MKRALLSTIFLTLLITSFSTPCWMFVRAEEPLWEEKVSEFGRYSGYSKPIYDRCARARDFFVYPEEVDAEGVSHYITEGKLRATMRTLHKPPYENFGLPYHRCYEEDVEPLPEEEPVELIFDLKPTSNQFDAGHRIRVTATCADSDNFETPMLDPAPTVTIYRNAVNTSYIELPIIPASAPGLEEETIARRDLVINLGDGVKTDAQLTLPSVGEGPFPGVLLVHGSGNTDMDEYLPPLVTGTEEPSRPFLQIAEYLSERGIAVLRYNKRGIGLNGTILDEGVVTNMTYQALQQDAEKALEVLLQQPEVDADDITILGHSEGTWMAPRIAINDSRVKKIVLMSAAAHNLYDILYFQIVERGIRQFEEIDSNHDGLLSIQEVSVLPPVMTEQLIENSTGEWLWIPGIDPNGDGHISLSEERLPLWTQTFEYLTTTEYTGSTWLQSHFALSKNLDIIGDVSASVLIQQGEGDTQTPVSEAFLLEQRLTEVGHPDHTLITYPGLGHTFYPREGLLQWLGPIQDYVLSDLADWLKDPARNTRYLEPQLETALDAASELRDLLDGERARVSGLEEQIEELQGQLDDEQAKINELDNAIARLEGENAELWNALTSSKSMNYIAIVIALIAVVAAILAFRKRAA